MLGISKLVNDVGDGPIRGHTENATAYYKCGVWQVRPHHTPKQMRGFFSLEI